MNWVAYVNVYGSYNEFIELVSVCECVWQGTNWLAYVNVYGRVQ